MNLEKVIQTKYHQLSKGQQKVAKVLLAQPKDFAVKSAHEIGLLSGVSETTVIRFCYSIELSGYSELQKTVREQLLFKESSLGQYFTSKLELANQPHFYAQVMERDRQHIGEIIHQISGEVFDQAADRLVAAEKIYVLGLRSSFPAANWLSFTLGLVRDHIVLIRPDTDDVLYALSGMDTSSVLIVISFHRYSSETIKIVEAAKEQGAFILGITDSPLAPIHPYADLLFPIQAPGKSTIDATPALFSVLNAIIAGISIKDQKRFKLRKEKYEKLNGAFFLAEGRGKN